MAKHKNRSRATVSTAPAETFDMSVSDPAMAEWLGLSGVGYNGVLTEARLLGLSAAYRCQTLIAGTIAGLPLKVYAGPDVEDEDGASPLRGEVAHFLSATPAGPYDMSAFNFVETVLLHMLNHGEAFLKHIVNGGGELVGYFPVSPMAIAKVEWEGPDKAFHVRMNDGTTEVIYSDTMRHIVGPSVDGLRGLSPLSLFGRSAFQTALSADRAANRSLSNGSLVAGLITSEEDIDPEDAKAITEGLKARLTGPDNAGDLVFINRMLKLSPFSMTNADAQLLESRSFSVEEFGRIYGVPSTLLNVSGAVSAFGTGIAEMNTGLARFTLMGWTSRIESALQRDMAPGEFVEFSYAGLLAGTPRVEIEMLIQQVESGILTVNEARGIRNLSPVAGGDVIRTAPVAPDFVPKPRSSQGGTQ